MGRAGIGPDLSITKTNGQTYFAPGQAVTYTIVVTNTSISVPAVGATVTDTLPVALEAATWSCAATAGSSCAASGSGDVSDTVSLLEGGAATYTLAATVSASATGPLSNTATVTFAGDPNSANDSATDSDPAQSAVQTRFFSVAPCRIMDTRGNDAPVQGPFLTAGVDRNVTVPPVCGVPVGAVSVSLNVTAVSPSANGFIRVEAAGVPSANTSTINFSLEQTRANNLVVGLSPTGQIRITLSDGTAHFVADVNGYFAAVTEP
jgi:uncharacterized repeat protein (TIGR01451 family)